MLETSNCLQKFFFVTCGNYYVRKIQAFGFGILHRNDLRSGTYLLALLCDFLPISVWN